MIQLFFRLLIRFPSILGPLKLYFESLGSNLESIHCLDRCMGCFIGGEGDKTETFGEVCLFVNEHFGGDNGSEWLECLVQVRVIELLR